MAFSSSSLPRSSQPITHFDDASPMPWGKFTGTPMEEVDASYLHWLWVNGKSIDMRCPVADYIRRNLTALKLEYNDGIWD